MSINQEVKETLFLEYPKKITDARENKFTLILLDCFTPAWWQVFWYHWSVWNVLWISTSNNKQPKCWIPDGIEADLPERKICHSRNMKSMPNDSCLHFSHYWSPAFKPVFCSLKYLIWQAELWGCSGNIMNSKIKPSAGNILELLPNCAEIKLLKLTSALFSSKTLSVLKIKFKTVVFKPIGLGQFLISFTLM